MAKKDEDKKADKKADKKKRGKGAADDYSSIATHPRARMSVRRTKGWFGLGGFVIAAALSLRASVPLFQTGERALIAGVAGYLLAWWASMLVWRQLMIAEQRAAIEEIERRRAEEEEAKAAEQS
jgi:hypothetical protein